MFSLQRYSTDSAVTFDLCDLNQSNPGGRGKDEASSDS